MATPVPDPRASLYYPTRLPRRRRPTVGNLHYRIAAILVGLLVVSAIFLYALETSHRTLIPPRTPTTPAINFPTQIQHLIIIFMENHARADVLANGSYETYLSHRYGTAADFHGATYNSLADYMDATSGSYTVGITQVSSIPQLVDNAKETWAAYMQSMPYPCDSVKSADGLYNPLHNPFVHYSYITGNSTYCASHVLGLDAWNQSVAAGTLPNYVFISPDMYNDSDNITSAVGDGWLHGFLTPFLNSSLFATSAVIVTYDSDAKESPPPGTVGNGVVFFAVLSPFTLLHYTSTNFYDDFNLLTTSEWILGLGRTNHNDNWFQDPPMIDLFYFGLTHTVTGSVSSQGKPVVDASVAGSGYWVTTDAAGGFSVPLPNGTYLLRAGAPGGACFSGITSVTVPGRNISQNFDLPCA